MSTSVEASQLKVSFVREFMKKRFSQKGAAVQRDLEPESRGISIVGALTKQLLVKTLRARKILIIQKLAENVQSGFY
jgi:hypothetical protein